ncbi:hypothetical protein Tco_1121345 [Tanacetum coccineum]|uniref:MAK10-like protein n=1 Tax=Tanacetum coccineum TaxID=301880 RepID=A0ABQ5IYU8_9ASTR
MVPLRFDTIRLVQNRCSFHGLWSKDPNQHLKDFLKLVDSVDLDGKNRERMFLRLFQFSLRDQDLALNDNESWNDPRDFAKPVKAIALPQDVPSTSDCRPIELETQVQRLMEAHLALTQPTQVKEQGKEEDEIENHVEIKEVIKDEESKIETDEEVKEIFEEEGLVMFKENDEKITFKMPHTMEIFKQTKLLGLSIDSIPPSTYKKL